MLNSANIKIFLKKNKNVKYTGSPSTASQKFFFASLQPQLSARKKILWLAVEEGRY